MAASAGGLVIQCSCGEGLSGSRAYSASLVTINEIAHEHIERVEAEVINRDAVNDVRLGRVATEGYGTKSAITSEDQLVDIESFMADECVGCTGLVHHDQCPMWVLPL
jgi:hypothetical protein